MSASAQSGSRQTWVQQLVKLVIIQFTHYS